MNTIKAILLSFFLFCAAPAFAQTAIPFGTVLPLELNSSTSLKSPPGKTIVARVMQDIPLSNGAVIHAGAKVTGQVLAVTPDSASGHGRLAIKFDRAIVGKQSIPITTDLRAMASFVDVEQANIPTTGPDRGIPWYAATTVLVGGDVDYKGGGPVTQGSRIVGKPTYGGVLSDLTAVPTCGCRAGFGGSNQRQALWVFSSDACGLYGSPNITIEHAGRTAPTGRIVLASNHHKLKIPGGTGILLRVVSNS